MKNIIDNLPIPRDIIIRIDLDKIVYLNGHILPIDTKNNSFLSKYDEVINIFHTFQENNLSIRILHNTSAGSRFSHSLIKNDE